MTHPRRPGVPTRANPGATRLAGRPTRVGVRLFVTPLSPPAPRLQPPPRADDQSAGHVPNRAVRCSVASDCRRFRIPELSGIGCSYRTSPGARSVGLAHCVGDAPNPGSDPGAEVGAAETRATTVGLSRVGARRRFEAWRHVRSRATKCTVRSRQCAGASSHPLEDREAVALEV